MARISLLILAALCALAGPAAVPAGAEGTPSQIVFVGQRSGQSDLYVANTDGTGRRNITRTAARSETMPAVSPDGSTVAFVSSAGGIWTIGIDGTGLTQLTGNASDREPDWFPDGSMLVFTRRQGDHDIWTIRADGTAPTKVLDNDVTDETPAVSPDGQWIAFSAPPVGMFIVHPDGSGLQYLASYFYCRKDQAWAPDSTRFAFTQCEFDGSSNIWIFELGSFGSTKVTTDAGQETRPAWSEDGLRIAYTGQVTGTGTNTAIFEVNVDGSGRLPLTPTSQRLIESDAEHVPSA